jgi:hypothetical protein
MLPPLSVPDTITVLRAKYREALICTACAALVATRPESYAKSHLTEEQRRAYVCAECSQEQAEAERVAEVRRQILAQNVATGRARKASQAIVQAAIEEGFDTDTESGTSGEVFPLQPSLAGAQARTSRPSASLDGRAEAEGA